MISIAKHIEILLLDHDCVVIPGFGGFITNYVASSVSEGSDGQMKCTPPSRTVRFNPALRANDGVLVQSYMRAYDTSYLSAERQLELDVASMRDIIETQGFYDFDGIGIIRSDLYGNLSFESDRENILTPKLYGLPSLKLKPFVSVEKEQDIKAELGRTTILPVVSNTLTNTDIPYKRNSESKVSASVGHVRSISNRLVDISISAAAAVIIFLLVSYPSMSRTDVSGVKVAGPIASISDATEQKLATHTSLSTTVENDSGSSCKTTHQEDLVKVGLHTDSLANRPERQKSNLSNETESVTTDKNTSVTVVSSDVDRTAQSTAEQKEINHAVFTIVLASYVSRPNADVFIEQLSKQGYKEARYAKENKVSRILYSKFHNREEAQKALNTLRSKSDDFADAWIMEIKDYN